MREEVASEGIDLPPEFEMGDAGARATKQTQIRYHISHQFTRQRALLTTFGVDREDSDSDTDTEFIPNQASITNNPSHHTGHPLFATGVSLESYPSASARIPVLNNPFNQQPSSIPPAQTTSSSIFPTQQASSTLSGAREPFNSPLIPNSTILSEVGNLSRFRYQGPYSPRTTSSTITSQSSHSTSHSQYALRIPVTRATRPNILLFGQAEQSSTSQTNTGSSFTATPRGRATGRRPPAPLLPTPANHPIPAGTFYSPLQSSQSQSSITSGPTSSQNADNLWYDRRFGRNPVPIRDIDALDMTDAELSAAPAALPEPSTQRASSVEILSQAPSTPSQPYLIRTQSLASLPQVLVDLGPRNQLIQILDEKLLDNILNERDLL